MNFNDFVKHVKCAIECFLCGKHFSTYSIAHQLQLKPQKNRMKLQLCNKYTHRTCHTNSDNCFWCL